LSTEETMDDLNRLCDLNVEILETILAVTKRLFDYTNEHGILLSGLDALHRLIRRAERLMEEMDSTPPRIRIRPSDENLHGDKSDEDLTESGGSNTYIDQKTPSSWQLLRTQFAFRDAGGGVNSTPRACSP